MTAIEVPFAIHWSKEDIGENRTKYSHPDYSGSFIHLHDLKVVISLAKANPSDAEIKEALQDNAMLGLKGEHVNLQLLLAEARMISHYRKLKPWYESPFEILPLRKGSFAIIEFLLPKRWVVFNSESDWDKYNSAVATMLYPQYAEMEDLLMAQNVIALYTGTLFSKFYTIYTKEVGSWIRAATGNQTQSWIEPTQESAYDDGLVTCPTCGFASMTLHPVGTVGGLLMYALELAVKEHSEKHPNCNGKLVWF